MRATCWTIWSRPWSRAWAPDGVQGSAPDQPYSRGAPLGVEWGVQPTSEQTLATPNYGYEKRQKELAKKRKKEEKLKAKAERKLLGPGDEAQDATDGVVADEAEGAAGNQPAGGA